MSEVFFLSYLVIYQFYKDHRTNVTIKGLNCSVQLNQNFSARHREVAALHFRVGSTASVKDSLILLGPFEMQDTRDPTGLGKAWENIYRL